MTQLENLVSKQLAEISKHFKQLTVSCSGGLDSVVLFHFLLRITKNENNFRLAILHFNFGLRGKESERDEKFVQKLAEEHKVPFILRKISTEERETRSVRNTQAWARNVRRQKFQELAEKGHLIALAHHEDDLAENILMRLARGAGPGQLMGMKTWAPPYWRPFLTLAKNDLQVWASRHNLPHVHDSSNDKMIYSRNVIRKQILPALERLYPGARARIARCGRNIQDFVDFSRTQWEEGKKNNLDSKAIIMQGTLQELPPGVTYDILSTSLGHVTGGLSYRTLEKTVEHTLANKSSQLKMTLPHNKGTLLSKNGAIYFEKEAPLPSKPRSFQHWSAIVKEKKVAVLSPQCAVTFFPVQTGSQAPSGLQIENMSAFPAIYSLFTGKKVKHKGPFSQVHLVNLGKKLKLWWSSNG